MATKVTPLPSVTFYWNAFVQLSSDRQVGMGVGPIPWTALDRFAARHGIDDPEQFDLLVRLVRALDHVYLEDAAARLEPKK